MVCCGITAENTAQWVHLLKNVAFFFFYRVGLMEMWILNVYVGLRLPWWMNEIPSGPNIMRVCVRTASRPVESLAPVKKKTRTVNFSAWWRINICCIGLNLLLSFFFCLSQNIAACRSGVPHLTPAVHSSCVSVLNSVYRHVSMFALNCILWSGTGVSNKQGSDL